MSAPLYPTGLFRRTARELPWWLKMLSGLPLAFLHALATAVVWVMRRVVRHRIETVRTNIERSFPQLSRREQRLIESRYFSNLAQVLAEVLKMADLSREELERRVRFSNPHLIRDAIAAGGSVPLVCAHPCNWEWQLLALSASLNVPIEAAYKPLRGPAR